MQRREFIKQSALSSSLAFVPKFIKNSGVLSYGSNTGKKLVVIQLSGGNDGLNTIIPYTNDIYYKSRPTISIKNTGLIEATDTLAFHTNLAPLKNLYDQGYLTIINSVGYPNPERSHFRSTDIWHTASHADQYLDTGWLGRYIEKYGSMPYDGIEIDDSLSLILKGNTRNGIATKDPTLLYRNMRTPFFKKVLGSQTDTHLSEHNLGYLYKTMIEAESSAKYIYETSKTYDTKLQYPKNPFGKQLKTTAEFINARLDTQVYFVSMGGFDTHAKQVKSQDKLLSTYAEAMDVFIKDLVQNDTFKDTLILTFSEFGRRVKQNAADGTDHGAANNVFIMGKNLKKQGFYNEDPNLSDLDGNGDIKYQVDFREIYSTILSEWFGVDDEAILKGAFRKIDFL